MAHSKATRERWHGLDLIRLFSMTAIVAFHANEAVFYTDRFPFEDRATLYGVLQPIFEFISFSGFTIVALSGFLFGLKPTSRREWLSLFVLLTVGSWILAASYGEDLLSGLAFEWDIYPYLLVTLAVLYPLRSQARALKVLGVLGVLLLWIPFWQWPGFHGDGAVQAAVIGICTPQGGGMWPLLPWSGLMWTSYSLGYFVRTDPALRERLQRWSKAETAIWVVLVTASAPWLGAYSAVPIGPGFGCFIHRRPPWEFWAHMIWIAFAMRISLLTNMNRFLGKWSLFRAVSQLAWSRHFGLSYLTHLLFLALGAQFSDFFRGSPLAFDVFFMSLLPLTEVTVRLVLKARSRIFQSSKVGPSL